jgi:phospholipid/cholesterol/gamma-HCH transport system permease protein
MAQTQPRITWFPLTQWVLAAAWRHGLHLLDVIGQAAVLLWQAGGFLLSGRWSPRQWLRQSAFVGVDTLGLALLMTTFFGMVIALQVAREMARQGTAQYIGALVSLAMVRELAPIMTAFAVCALAGSAYAAELGYMRVQSQVDALHMLHIHPARHLVLPRLLAGTTMVPLMSVVTAMAGIFSGWLVTCVMVPDFQPRMYWDATWQQLQLKDILVGLIKASVFGFLVMLFSATLGLGTRGGAKEVASNTTRAVVWSFLAMAVSDYLLTALFYGQEH